MGCQACRRADRGAGQGGGRVSEKNDLFAFAKSGVLPQRVSATGAGDEPLTEAVICEAISGGADYENNMPRKLTLCRRLADGTEGRHPDAGCPVPDQSPDACRQACP